jgi:hypothetical protein
MFQGKITNHIANLTPVYIIVNQTWEGLASIGPTERAVKISKFHECYWRVGMSEEGTSRYGNYHIF